MFFKKLFSTTLAAFMLFSSTIAFADTNKTNSSENFASVKNINLNTNYNLAIDQSDFEAVNVRFTIPSDGFIHFKFKKTKDSSGNIEDWTVDLFDNNGREVLYGSTGYDSFTNDDYHHYAIGLKKGTYRITLSGMTDNSTIPFRVNFTSTNNFEKEKNNSRTTATSVNLNQIYTGISGESFESTEDWYKFYIGAKSDVTFKIHYPSNSEPGSFALYNTKGDLVEYISPDYDMELNRGVLSYTFSDLPSSTYYLEMSGDYSAYKIPYQFSINASVSNTSTPKKTLTKDIYKYDAGSGKYLTYINGKGYSQYVYLNTSGKYAFTPSSWMVAAGLNVTMPTSDNNYKMTIDNAYKNRYEYAQKVLAEAKKGNLTPREIKSALEDIENLYTGTTKSSPRKTLTKDIYKYDAGSGKYTTYINGKGYSQYVYLNTSGKYAFTPSSWMVAAGLDVTMPTSSNGYKMTINNPYLSKYNSVVKEINNYL